MLIPRSYVASRGKSRENCSSVTVKILLVDVVSGRTLSQKQWKVWSVYILFSRKCEKVTSIFSLHRHFENAC